MTGGILSTYDLKQKANSDSLVSFMGVIRAKDEIKMNRMIIRMGRGRAIATFFDMDIPQYLSFNIMNKDEEKKIFIVIFPTEAKEYLMKKMLQICDLLSASHYIPPEDKKEEKIVEEKKEDKIEEKNEEKEKNENIEEKVEDKKEEKNEEKIAKKKSEKKKNKNKNKKKEKNEKEEKKVLDFVVDDDRDGGWETIGEKKDEKKGKEQREEEKQKAKELKKMIL